MPLDNPLLSPDLDPNGLKAPTKTDAASASYKPSSTLGGATQGINSGLSDRLAMDRVKADIAENNATVPQLRAPPKQEAQTDPFQAFGQPAMWIAALGSLFTRQPFVNAIKAGGAVLQATQQLDAAAAKQNFEVWKVETENGLKMAQFQQKQYEDALKRIDVDSKSGKAEIETNIAAYKDMVAQQVYQQEGIPGLKKLLFARGKQTDAVGQSEKAFENHIKMETLNTYFSALSSGDPAQMEKAKQLAGGLKLLSTGELPSDKAADREGKEWKQAVDPTTNTPYLFKADASGNVVAKDMEGNDYHPQGMAHMGSSTAPTINDDAAKLIAESFIGGNHAAASGLARSPANMGLVQKWVAKLAPAGMTGDDLNANFLQYAGGQAGARRIGAAGAMVDQGARELSYLIPQAKEASSKVVRWGAVPIDKIKQALMGASNDPELADFAAANNGVANAFALVMRRGGAPTDQSSSHAFDLLSTARDQKSYETVLDRLDKEAMAVLRSTSDTQGDIIQRATGGQGHASGGSADPHALPDGSVVTQGGIKYRKQGNDWLPVQ